VNVLWGAFNLVVGYMLIFHVGAFEIRSIPHALAAGLGLVCMGLMLARSFGRFHGGNSPLR